MGTCRAPTLQEESGLLTAVHTDKVSDELDHADGRHTNVWALDSSTISAVARIAFGRVRRED